MGNRFGWHFNDWPLQLKLNFVALMVFIPTMIFGTSYFFYHVYWLEVKTGLSGLMNFVDAKQQGVIGFIGRNEKMTRQLAELSGMTDAAALRKHLKNIVDTDIYDPAQHPFRDEVTAGKRVIPTWKTYHAIDLVRNGVIEISSDPAREGQAWTHQLDLKAGYSDVYRDGEKIMLSFGAPTPDGGMLYVHADGQILTLIISGELGNMEGGMGAFYGAGLNKAIDYYIVNRDNVLITESPNHPGSLLNMKGSEHPWKLSRQEAGIACSQNGTYTTNADCTTGCREAMGFYVDHQGQDMLGVSMPFYDSGWTIVVEQSEAELLGSLWDVLKLVVTVATLLLAVSIIIFVRTTQNRIVRPLTRLTEAIRKASDGRGKIDTTIRYDTGHGDEVGEISRAFDDLQEKLHSTLVSRTFFFQIMENIGRALFVTDNEGYITLVNVTAEELTGYQRAEMIGMPLGLIAPIANTPLEEFKLDCECISASGEIIPVSCTRTPISEGEVFVLGDLRERLEAQAQLRLAAKVIENAAQGLIITDLHGTIIDVNPAFSECTGFSREETLGKTPAMLRSGLHDQAFYQRMWETIKAEGHWQGEIWNRRKNGDIFPEWLSIAAVLDLKGNPTHYVALFYDITEKKAQEKRIEHIAFHDALTGLANRALLNEKLEQALARRERQGDTLALFFLDLDRFKLINDTLGHDVGDELLKTVAQRLSSCVRATDIVCRQGGDEFILVITDIVDTSAAGRLAEKILARLAEPITIGNETISTSFSIGIALFPDDATDTVTLFKHADEAMYQSKQAGRNTYRYYNESMNTQSKQVMQVETGLRRALDENQLLLHYQPQYDIASGRIVGAEALVRWNDPEAGIIMPAVFIPVAEESGLITRVGEWVLNEAFRQMTEWRSAGLPDVRMAVNISAVQFRRCDLSRLVASALAQHGVAPGNVELEITESLLVQDDVKISETLKALKQLGASLAIDDFGTGYSSLSYLRRFNVDCIKIDRSFVRDLGVSNDQDAIVQAIVDMARSLKLKLVAEGVETPDQLDLLKRMGCTTAQGYLFAKPLPAAEFTELLRSQS